MEHAQVLERFADLDGVVHRVRAVDVDQDVDIVADCFPHCCDRGDRLVGRVVDGAGDRAVQLVRVVSLLDEGRGAAALFFRRQVAGHRTSVHVDLVVNFAAQQLVDRHPERFAFDVPQGDVNRADGCHDVGAAPEQRSAEHVLPVALDVQGVFADEVFGAVAHAG